MRLVLVDGTSLPHGILPKHVPRLPQEIYEWTHALMLAPAAIVAPGKRGAPAPARSGRGG